MTAAVALALFYLLHEFRGLATSQAMDQAQIARELARGHGWRTNWVRPLAVAQLRENQRPVLPAVWLDTYQAPLPSLVNALALLATQSRWHMALTDTYYAGDEIIALFSILFFLAAVGVLYLIARELFDPSLALLACSLVLLCDTMWRYALSGLPQMLLLLLFHAAVYALIRAMRARYLGGRTLLWLAAAGTLFGLLALGHALTVWVFVPAVVFVALWFENKTAAAGVMVAAFLIVYSPWLMRNYHVCGTPWGLAINDLASDTTSSAAQMRALELKADFSPVLLLHKARVNLVTQFNRIFEYLGWSWAAPFAIASLLHVFKRPLNAGLRWGLMAMWAGAICGMALFGLMEEQGFAANQLHLLFMPLFTCYGLAFLATRLRERAGLSYLLPGWNARAHLVVRNLGAGLLILLSGLPTFFTLLAHNWVSPVRWPPYFPVYLSVLHDWMKQDELTATDMPWAISWYADRPALWLPATVRDYTELSDNLVLGMPIRAVFLTPISGSQNTLGDISDGDYRDWAPLILRSWNVEKFPLHYSLTLGSKDYLFVSDRDRRVRQ